MLADPTFPQKVNPTYNLGIVLLRLDRPAEALQAFYRVAEADSDRRGIHGLIGQAQEAGGDCSKAVANYLEALKQDDSDAKIAFRLAGCLDSLGKSELALRYYRHVIKLSPDSSEAIEARERVIEGV